MKIIRLEAEGFRRLRAINIAPKGRGVTEITGRNAQGKSSAIDAIWSALGGKNADPKSPINNGRDEAKITVRLGDDGKTALKVTRKFIRQDDGSYTSSLKVENGDGARYDKPATMLAALTGALSFDPLKFEDMEPRQQLETFQQFVSGYDFADHDRRQKADYDERTNQNRIAKQARAQLDGIAIDPDAPKAEIDTAALRERLNGAVATNADIARRKGERDTAAKQAADSRIKAAALTAEAEKLKAEADRLYAEAQEIEEELAIAKPLPPLVDMAAVSKELEEAQVANLRYERARSMQADYDRVLKTATDAEAASQALSEDMAARDAKKEDAIKSAAMPVDGITFGDGEILFNGLPFSDASQAERLMVSMAVGMALNPTLRVILVRDASRLDEESWAAIDRMAAEHDFQAWMESVQTGSDPVRDTAIIIEDGEVRQ